MTAKNILIFIFAMPLSLLFTNVLVWVIGFIFLWFIFFPAMISDTKGLNFFLVFFIYNGITVATALLMAYLKQDLDKILTMGVSQFAFVIFIGVGFAI